MRTFLLLLATLLLAAPAGADSAFPGPAYPERGGEEGGLAPGVANGTANLDTFRWIWGLQRVPFPDRIDDGQWTDLYFSHDAGGLWPQGDDTNNGLSPLEPKETLAEWKVECLKPFVRCNDDPGDNRTNADGADAIFGVIADADVDVTGCPTSSFRAAHEQPCFWWRSGSPSTTQLWDFSGVSGGTTLDIATITKRAHLLIEGISITGEDQSFTGVGTPPIDTHEIGMISVVGNLTLDYAGAPGGTGNVLSAHDVSHTAAYGDVTLQYSGTSTSGGSPAIVANVSGAVAYHSANQVVGCLECEGFSLNQSTGNPASSLDAEALVTPLQAFISGSHIQTDGNGTNIHELGRVTADDTGGNRSDHVVAVLLGTALETTNVGVSSSLIQINATGASSRGELRILYPTFMATGVDDPTFTFVSNIIESAADYDIVVAGCILEPNADSFNAGSLVRIDDDDWAGSASNSLRFVDCLYDPNQIDLFRIGTAGGDCLEDDPAAMEICYSALPSGNAATLDLDNNVDPVSLDATGTVDSATSTTITVAGTPWSANEWTDAIVRMTSGSASPLPRRVTSNTTSQLTFSPAMGTTPSGTDTFSIEHYVDVAGRCATDEDADCESHPVAGSDYQFALPERIQIPSFITGERVTRIDVSQPDAGRSAPEPWATR